MRFGTWAFFPSLLNWNFGRSHRQRHWVTAGLPRWAHYLKKTRMLVAWVQADEEWEVVREKESVYVRKGITAWVGLTSSGQSSSKGPGCPLRKRFPLLAWQNKPQYWRKATRQGTEVPFMKCGQSPGNARRKSGSSVIPPQGREFCQQPECTLEAAASPVESPDENAASQALDCSPCETLSRRLN